MFKYIKNSAKQQSKLIILMTAGFVLSLLGGMVIAKWGPESVTSLLTIEDTSGNEQIEKIFSRFRESVQNGDFGTMAICMLIVFGLNTLGSIMRTISTCLIFPLVFFFFSAMMIGASVVDLEASSFISLFLFLLMVALEWMTYILSAVAGTHIGLAVIRPKRVECTARWMAFKRAIGHAGGLYVLITGILVIQAIFEILYVRKVLLMGDTGVPLAPW